MVAQIREAAPTQFRSSAPLLIIARSGSNGVCLICSVNLHRLVFVLKHIYGCDYKVICNIFDLIDPQNQVIIF